MSVLVYAERSEAGWHRMAREALAAGQDLARQLGCPAMAVVAGHGIGEAASDLAKQQFDRVWALDHELLADFTADGYTAALEALVKHISPDWVVFGHTYQARDFAAKLATRFGSSLVSDVVRVRIEDGSPVFVRQLFQGKLHADVRAAGKGPHFVSMQAGVYRPEQVMEGSAPVETLPLELADGVVRTRPQEPFREAENAVDLTSAGVIVSVGRGIKEKDHLPMAEELAKLLGGELAASRPVCDNGWLPMDRQIGSSGQTVSPKLYLAVGISGAIQHLVGMKGSKTIVAINRDPDAPIFEVAHYGIAGDLFQVLPALIEELKKRSS